MPKKKPSITELAEHLKKFSCDHLVGREVIEKSIAELAVAKLAGKDYCQNWDRCPKEGWSKCTPDMIGLISKVQKLETEVFTKNELNIIASLKQKGNL